MRTLRFIISYEGGNFEGYQLQPACRTVQGEIETALAGLCGRPLRPTAAGRTDAGVHAAAQVLTLEVPDEVTLPCKAFLHGLNGRLPDDLAVLAVEECQPGFDARRDALGKHYRYRLLHRPTRHPLYQHTHWLLFGPLDASAMGVACAAFVGEHDFASLRAADCQSRTTVRKLSRVELAVRQLEEGGRELTLDVEGTAFLKHMVRTLAGTLVAVGRGRFKPEDIPRILAARDRARAGVTAPAHGLTLMSVRYPQPVGFAWRVE